MCKQPPACIYLYLYLCVCGWVSALFCAYRQVGLDGRVEQLDPNRGQHLVEVKCHVCVRSMDGSALSRVGSMGLLALEMRTSNYDQADL